MSELMAPVVWAACFLLAAGGAAKLRQPASTVLALRSAGLPAHRIAVRALAVFEIALGCVCIARPNPVALVLLALVYAGFAAFIARLVMLGAPGLSCGCAGRRDIPSSWLHVVLNLVGAAAAAAAAALGPQGFWQLGPAGFAAVAGAAVIAWAAFLTVAYVPELFGSWRGSAA
jgi:hypothetical protein